MITDAYNKHSATSYVIEDNSAVKQGGLTRGMASVAHQASNANHAPVSSLSSPHASSFSKELKQKQIGTSKREDNPISMEMASDGLGALFGAATGLDFVELLIDYGTDAVEFRDEYVADRPQYKRTTPAPQPDPRLWMQPVMPMPTPGWAIAA